jgi:acetyl-CoA carboxylase biotin carboxyl carrier protein
MDITYLKKIIKLVESSDIDELEVEEEGKKIRVVKSKPNNIALQHMIPAPVPYLPGSMAPAAGSDVKTADLSAAANPKYHEILSPIVGTFYRAPSPDAESYVEIGQSVKVGTVLCIVEAMKLMNELESDIDGKIVKIMVENGKPVEYNQVLFLIEKS